jgi:hypothetical protein
LVLSVLGSVLPAAAFLAATSWALAFFGALRAGARPFAAELAAEAAASSGAELSWPDCALAAAWLADDAAFGLLPLLALLVCLAWESSAVCFGLGVLAGLLGFGGGAGCLACLAAVAFISCANRSLVEGFLLDDCELLEAELSEDGRILSATCHQSIGPRARGALVGFLLLPFVSGADFLGLEALDHLTNGLGALGGALPVLPFAVALRARASHDLGLLTNSFFEARQEGLVVARKVGVDAGPGTDVEAVNVARVVTLELGELRLALGDPALAAGECFGAAPLEIVDDVLNYF